MHATNWLLVDLGILAYSTQMPDPELDFGPDMVEDAAPGSPPLHPDSKRAR